MKNQKISKNRIIVLVVVIILLSVTSVGLFAIFHLCNIKEKQENTAKAIENNLDMLLQVKEQNASNNIGIDIANEMICDISYEIIDIKDNLAVISVSSPNIYALYKKVILEQGDAVPSNSEEYNELLNTLLCKIKEDLTNSNYERTFSTISVIIDDDGNAEISHELLDAMYGGLLTLQEELTNAYMGGNKK